ncbi:ATP-binding protein [Niabella sp. W65]|nr:ATP-binding protein [Niabella sp. W65]MCH7366675.1 ATP-binding protein [Niabella sp. W65]ULT46038.1 ATP-binding protein [Niabella sp. I65]
MTNSLETLLNIAEIRLNREVPFDDCDFEEAINAVVDQLAGDILKRNIDIQRNLGVGKIYYPRPYLESILYNLVSNAVKYCNPLVASKIWISTNIVEGGAIALQVRDNGFGIDMVKYGDKIFKLNQVFHKGMDSKGVGLYLTKPRSSL